MSSSHVFRKLSFICAACIVLIVVNGSVGNARMTAQEAAEVLERAAKDYELIVKYDPNNPDAHLYLGISYDALGRTIEARREYKTTIKLDPNNAVAYNNLGLTYDDYKGHKKAIKAFKKAIKLNPNLADPHYNLAMLYYLGGNREGFKKEYVELKRVDNDMADELLKKLSESPKARFLHEWMYDFKK